MMEDIWKDIKGYEGVYQISNFGTVKILYRKYKAIRFGKDTLITKQAGILKHHISTTGYFYVVLSNKNKSRKNKLHRLLAEAFIPNPHNHPIINHKDGNKLNNSLNNLEWCTHSHNLRHATKTGLKVSNRGEKWHASILTEKQVLEIRKLFGTLSERKIAKLYDCHRSTINWILSGRTWKHI